MNCALLLNNNTIVLDICSGLDERADGEFVHLDNGETDKPEMAEWVQMLSEFYPANSIPADWDWPKATLKAHFPQLDLVDTALFCIFADLSDRFTDAISPMKNLSVLAAYKAYFDKPSLIRGLVEFETLVKAIVNASKEFRSKHPTETMRSCEGMLLLEWCMLADALNNSKLGGNSTANILMCHSNEKSWKNFKSCAAKFALAAECTDHTQEFQHFLKGADILGIISKNRYRPLHMYRLFCFVIDKTDGGVDGWFNVNNELRSAFKKRLPHFLAAVAACQCAKVPRTRSNFTFLTAVAEDRAGFLKVAANLTEEETIQVKTLLHFGPARFIQSTSAAGLLSRAFCKYRQAI